MTDRDAAVDAVCKAATADFVAWGPPPSRVKWPEWQRLRAAVEQYGREQRIEALEEINRERDLCRCWPDQQCSFHKRIAELERQRGD